MSLFSLSPDGQSVRIDQRKLTKGVMAQRGVAKAIAEVGEEVADLARGILEGGYQIDSSTAGTEQGSELRLERMTRLIVFKDVRTRPTSGGIPSGQPVLVGLVVSNHPESADVEYGTAEEAPVKFMARAREEAARKPYLKVSHRD